MKNLLWIILGVLVIGGGYWLYNQNKVGQRADITLGAPLLLSGDFSSYGERVRNATDLAVEDFKTEHPSTTVSVIYEDTHGDPKQTLSSYRKLIDIDHVDAIVGPMLQTEMGALEPVIAQDGVPVFSLAPVPLADRSGSANTLVLWPDPTREAGQMAQYVYGQGVRKVGILGTQDAWETEVANAFKQEFSALGGTVTDTEITLADSKDDRATITKLLASKPDVIFFGTYYKFFDWVKTVHEFGFTGKLFSIEIDSALAEQTQTLSDGLQFISPNFYTPKFVAEYQAKYGEQPTIPAGQAYDATTLALTTLYQNKERANVLAAMKALKTYQGVSGIITFEGSRVTFPLNIFQINNGQINKVN